MLQLPQKVTFVLFVIFVLSCSSKNDNKQLELNGLTMGTSYSIKVIPKNLNLNNKTLKQKIDSVLSDVNSKMSTYTKNSELMKFNETNDTNWVKVSVDLASVISQAIEVSKLSNGMFDITVGPLVNLWGFGPEENKKNIPDENEITQLKNKIGYRNIEVNLQKSEIRKKKPGIFCDLSGIAKGFGVDKVAMLLDELNMQNYMIEIGGEVRTKGLNNENQKWRIGIATPTNNRLEKIVLLSGSSMATSGDYLNYFEVNGKRYSHTINPLTGKPVTHKLASVSVIHKECSYADAFATAIEVMGDEEGFKFALKQNLPIFMIIRKNNNFVEKMTPAFKKFIMKGK